MVGGKVVKEGIQAQFIGAANVTNLLLQELRGRHDPTLQQARLSDFEVMLSVKTVSGFEVMLSVKGIMKEDQMRVAEVINTKMMNFVLTIIDFVLNNDEFCN